MEPLVQQVEKSPLNKWATVRKEIFEWVKLLAIVVVIALVVRTYLFTMIRVEGKSMLETLGDGDRLVATIIDLKLTGPKRGDIVICTYPGRSDLVIKRVVGMPGETISIMDGQTYIDGAPLDEPYIGNPRARDVVQPTVLGEDEYFVMGDNRAISRDSRSQAVGAIKRDAIKAKARLRIWPFNEGGIIP